MSSSTGEILKKRLSIVDIPSEQLSVEVEAYLVRARKSVVHFKGENMWNTVNLEVAASTLSNMADVCRRYPPRRSEVPLLIEEKKSVIGRC
jgi:hypothetical protein